MPIVPVVNPIALVADPPKVNQSNSVSGITNKQFVDTSTFFESASDIAHSTKLGFDLSGFAQDHKARTVAFFDQPSQTVVNTDAKQNLNGKKLICGGANSCAIADSTDDSKRITFANDGQASGTTLGINVITQHTNTVTVPDLLSNDRQFVFDSLPQTLTNKSLQLTTTGGTPSTLDYYEQILSTTSSPWTGFTAPQTMTYSLIRIGKLVTFNWDAMTGTSSGGSIQSTAGEIPARFRPVFPIQWAGQGADSGGPALVCMSIDNGTGTILIGSGITQAFFTGDALSGIEGGSISWAVA